MLLVRAEPELITVTESEKSVLKEVEDFMEQASGASFIPLRLIGPDGSTVALPEAVSYMLHTAIHHLTQGQAVTIVPIDRELTTQQAADLLNVSRPYLIKLLEREDIPYTKTGTHRRILFTDMVNYKVARDAQRTKALSDLTQLSQELGLYDG